MTTTRRCDRDPPERSEGRTCGSLTSSHQDSATTPGRMKHARLSTWPFTTCATHHSSQTAGTQPYPAAQLSSSSILSDKGAATRRSNQRFSPEAVREDCHLS
jgi:hypothetical protein